MAKKRWMYRLPENFYAFGATRPMHKNELKDFLRAEYGRRGRIPRGTEYWEA